MQTKSSTTNLESNRPFWNNSKVCLPENEIDRQTNSSSHIEKRLNNWGTGYMGSNVKYI